MTYFLPGQNKTEESTAKSKWHASTCVKMEPFVQKPTFIQPIVNCIVHHGEVARFHACVCGIPAPDISWFHNQQLIKPTKNVVFHFDEMTNIATLIIVDAFLEHAGQYICKATNHAGETVCSATLYITNEGKVCVFFFLK